MNREQKAAVIDEVAAQIKEADTIFAVDYRGISVTQAVELRARLIDADATLRVVKNRLTERAADKAGAAFLKELLEGPTAFTFVHGDAATAAKALDAFRRETQLLEFKGGTMGGQPLSVDEVQTIARLPAREALQGQFVGVLASPISGLVRGLASLISGLAVQLHQIEEKGLLADGGAAPEGTADGAAAEAEAPSEGGTEEAPEAPAEAGTEDATEAPPEGGAGSEQEEA